MINILVPVSRLRYLDRFFDSLNKLEGEANLFVLVDGDHRLYEKARNLTVKSKFNQRLCIFRAKGTPSQAQKRRKQRISDIHNEIKTYINGGEFVFLTEDDTLLPPDTLTKLMPLYGDSGLVSGVQAGRHGFTHIGAWDVGETIVSVPMGTGLREVDATGFYCLLTRTEYYLDHDFKPYKDILGPDVDFGMGLRAKGLKNYIDYSIQCTHMTPKEDIEVKDIVQVQVHPNGAVEKLP
jgi:hypothetical protein